MRRRSRSLVSAAGPRRAEPSQRDDVHTAYARYRHALRFLGGQPRRRDPGRPGGRPHSSPPAHARDSGGREHCLGPTGRRPLSAPPRPSRRAIGGGVGRRSPLLDTLSSVEHPSVLTARRAAFGDPARTAPGNARDRNRQTRSPRRVSGSSASTSRLRTSTPQIRREGDGAVVIADVGGVVDERQGSLLRPTSQRRGPWTRWRSSATRLGSARAQHGPSSVLSASVENTRPPPSAAACSVATAVRSDPP